LLRSIILIARVNIPTDLSHAARLTSPAPPSPQPSPRRRAARLTSPLSRPPHAPPCSPPPYSSPKPHLLPDSPKLPTTASALCHRAPLVSPPPPTPVPSQRRRRHRAHSNRCLPRLCMPRRRSRLHTSLSTGDTRRPDIEGIGVRWYEDLRRTTSSKQNTRIILVQAPW
jgi:hypothetical protein